MNRKRMNRIRKAGIAVLLAGIAIYLIFADEISGVNQAIIIGLVIGAVLSGQFVEE